MIDFINDKKYIINLQKRPDRREHIIAQMESIAALNYEIFDAIDGDFIGYTGQTKTGEAGVRLSHLEIIKTARNKKLPHVIIIEDDCIFLPYFLNAIKNLEIPPQWQLFYYGTFNKNPLFPLYGISNVKKCNYSLSALCYAVNSTIYDYLINKLQQDKILDIIYAEEVQQEKKCYSAFPSLVKQLGGYSDIQKRKVNYEGLYI